MCDYKDAARNDLKEKQEDAQGRQNVQVSLKDAQKSFARKAINQLNVIESLNILVSLSGELLLLLW